MSARGRHPRSQQPARTAEKLEEAAKCETIESVGAALRRQRENPEL